MSFEWIVPLVARLVTDADDIAAADRLILQQAAGGSDGARAYLELCRLVGESADSEAVIAALDDTATGTDAAALLGKAVVHCFAAITASYAAQPDAAAAREALGARASAAYPAIGTDLGHDALDFAVRLVGQTALELSRLAANLSPLVRVETAVSLPSALIAFDLYKDPARGGEIVDRNRTGTPMLLPSPLVALAGDGGHAGLAGEGLAGLEGVAQPPQVDDPVPTIPPALVGYAVFWPNGAPMLWPDGSLMIWRE